MREEREGGGKCEKVGENRKEERGLVKGKGFWGRGWGKGEGG